MPDDPATGFGSGAPAFGGASLVARSIAGGALMGLANLVPGVSGGTMLLAVGLYPQFIAGVAEASTLKLRAPVLLMLACVAGSAVLAIAGGARAIGAVLDRYPWVMYSLFIGLAAGGIPIVWRLVRPLDRTVALSAAAAVAGMVLLAVLDPERVSRVGAPGPGTYALLVAAGVSGGAAMILPGVSGAYLLLVLGQYRPILDAVAQAVAVVRAGAWDAAGPLLHVLVPVAVGVVAGVAGVSNLVRLLLATQRRATLGFLLGLLLGAVVGLWPFTEPVQPRVGDVVGGRKLLSPEMVAAIDPADHPRRRTLPTPGQAGGGVLLVLDGFGASWGVSRLGA
ncbi:MAG: DUF368 domain-containing protein [Acidobacteria bacterium]|nr:DUF368 domain-containing protein [Acidobacteriota bacterium]